MFIYRNKNQKVFIFFGIFVITHKLYIDVKKIEKKHLLKQNNKIIYIQ